MKNFTFLLLGLIFISTCLFAQLDVTNRSTEATIETQEAERINDLYQFEYYDQIKNSARIKQTNSITNYDITFYYLNVDISIDSAYIEGDVLCRFKSVENNLQEIKLNLFNAFTIDSITGNISNYNFANDTIYINLDTSYPSGTEAEVRIYYRGVPQPAAGIAGFQFHVRNGVPVIATACEPFFSYLWWPCKDGAGDKADSVYIDITIPDTTINSEELIALSNGTLENVITGAGKKTFQWRERYSIATYYIMIAVSNYRHFQHNYSGQFGENFPIDYWVFPENFNAAQNAVIGMPDAMEFLSNLFGVFPFTSEKYAMTQLDESFTSGLENQTNTILGATFWQSAYTTLFVHELSHSWFGCMISFEDLRNVWLNEGFATYCEALWVEHVNGQNWYTIYMDFLKYYGSGTIYHHVVPSELWEIFNPDLQYRKAAYVLHMLRGVLGDSLFFDCLSQYANQPNLMYQHAITQDFKNVCENISGINLDFFFDQWIFDEYYPKYEYSFNQDISTFETTVQINQVQADSGWRPVFEMPIQLRIDYQDNSDTLVTVWNDQQIQDFSLNLNKPITNIVFDPDEWILKQAVVLDIEDKSTNALPLLFDLQQNYPNPFNPTTTIEFSIPKTEIVTLKIYNTIGQEVATLVSEKLTAGNYKYTWDAGSLASGVYYSKLKTKSGFSKTRKLILIR